MMSEPSSDGRPSVSSEQSATSSHTLNSRWSGAKEDNDNGESSSSSQRLGRASSRNKHRGGFDVSDMQSRSSHSPLGAEAIEEQDFARRRHRTRASGSFLLDSTFGGPRSRHSSRHSVNLDDAKGKRSSRHGHDHKYDPRNPQARVAIENEAPSHSSPLSREVMAASQTSTEDETRIDVADSPQENGELRLPKTRKSVREPSPTSRNRDVQFEEPPRPAIDPNQIVHMALSLGESRRRNMSVGQLITPQATGSRRATSTGIQDGSFRDYGAGSSLRQYLNEQRRVSRNISPFGGKSSSSQQMSVPMNRRVSTTVQGRNPSPATFARRDKARAYIELRMEYLRLLDLLPPLKPDSQAPGNFIITANNVPGSPHAYLTRVPSHAGAKHDLGRAYNPLQYLRNRRCRARERKSLIHTAEEFLDVEQVRDWVDRVEQESQHPAYRRQDGVTLPTYRDEVNSSEKNPSKPPRPRMGWMFTPEELLADAHWLEQEDNKFIIEDRHGHRIFPPSRPQKQDSLQPRQSKEYPEKRRRSWVDGLPRVSADMGTGDESDPTSERGRKRRLLPGFRAESPKHKKHHWRHGGVRSTSHSDSSDSDSDSNKRSKGDTRHAGANMSTGPLGLHLKNMLEREAKESKVYSPALISPDTPDKWGIGHLDAIDGRSARSSMEYANGSAKEDNPLGLKMPPKRATNQTLLTEPRSSFDDLDSTVPNTPLRSKRFPHLESDSSRPPSRGESIKKTKKSRLDMFRPDDSIKGHKNELDSAGTDKKRSSRPNSEVVDDGSGLGAAILAAPGAVKSLLHRKNDSVSSLPSPENRKELRESRDPSSAVTRFFKGVKGEGSKMGGFIFRRDRPAEDSDSDLDAINTMPEHYDTDEGISKGLRASRPKPSRTTTSTTIGSVTSKFNGRYHLDLPSFRSQNDADKPYASDSGLPDDHVSRQARARANSRSPRFDRLAPGRLDLRSLSATSGDSRSPSSDSAQSRLNKVLARPGGVGQGGIPITSLANPIVSDPSLNLAPSRPKLDKRHWSITDDNSSSMLLKHTAANIVTGADIARVRALFLCSGVKAREIYRRAHEKRSEAPPFLVRAAKVTNAELIPIARKEEHVLAARFLVHNLETSTEALERSATQFREDTIQTISESINQLKARVEADLFPRVRDSGDEAMRITSEVSAAAPLSVKQISDEIDKMIRARRRRMRWVRRVGWMFVEWLLVGIMWWVWLVVVILGTFKRIIGGGVSVVRWLLWL